MNVRLISDYRNFMAQLGRRAFGSVIERRGCKRENTVNWTGCWKWRGIERYLLKLNTTTARTRTFSLTTSIFPSCSFSILPQDSPFVKWLNGTTQIPLFPVPSRCCRVYTKRKRMNSLSIFSTDNLPSVELK